jgi:hypothetical protein
MQIRKLIGCHFASSSIQVEQLADRLAAASLLDDRREAMHHLHTYAATEKVVSGEQDWGA